MAIRISVCAPDAPELLSLIAAQIAHSQRSSAPGSNHTLGLAELSGPELTFWVARDGNDLCLGCVAAKRVDGDELELKSLHVHEDARGRGVGLNLVRHVIAIAQTEFYQSLVLETGWDDAYASARHVYESLGFEYCAAIPGYDPDPNSAFMRLPLDPDRKQSNNTV